MRLKSRDQKSGNAVEFLSSMVTSARVNFNGIMGQNVDLKDPDKGPSI